MWSVHYDLSIDTARADALFASVLQISDAPSAVQVIQAIDAATSALGDLGCAARVAQEFGEHPETAVTRMRWPGKKWPSRSAAHRPGQATPPGTPGRLAPAPPRGCPATWPASRLAATCCWPVSGRYASRPADSDLGRIR
jgi:hypothetical protein